MKIPDIAEHQAIKLFTKEFGTDFNTRLEKFNEECKELNDVITEWNEEPTIERLEHIKDEFSDVQGTFTHLASLFGLYQREMLYNCIDKVTTRKTNPDYKRFDNVGFINRVKTSIIPKPEFDKVENDFTIKRTTTQITGHPVAIPEKDYWIKPDPEFYYTEEMVIDAWKRVYESRETVKMVKCNQQGIQIENDNEHD